MAETEIFSAINLPVPGPHPSISCIQWSDDGQLVLCTKNSILILTPDLGINFDNLSLLKTDRRNLQEDGSKDPGLDLGWHKNLIELEKNPVHSWPSDTQECGAINLGSLEVSWRSVAVSPGNLSNVSTGSGSLLVAMNTNLELTLWRAAKNHLKEAWTKMQDITSTLKELPCPPGSGPQDRCLYSRMLQAQVNCMAWSQQAEFGVRPSPLIDGSLLALGNRAGSIVFMRYDGDQSLVPIHVLRIADEWVTRLAWGSWRSSQPYHSEAYLACGLADGAIVIVHIRQQMEAPIPSNSFAPDSELRVHFEILSTRASESDGKGITALAWLDRPEKPQEKASPVTTSFGVANLSSLSISIQPILFHAKPGLFCFCQLAAQVEGGDAPLQPSQESHFLRVQRIETSVDSSPFYPVSGLTHACSSDNDALIVGLFDGSFHVVHNAWTSPRFGVADQLQSATVTESESRWKEFTSARLSALARRIFVQAEGGALRQIDVGRISGVVEFDGFGTVLWLHEACRPTDFSYKHDAKHNSMLVVARLWRQPRDLDLLLSRISDTFQRPRTLLGLAPSSLLRPILLHLCQRKIFDAIWSRVLPLFSSGPEEPEHESSVPSWAGVVDEAERSAFRRSLAIALHGWEAFHSLRLRLAIADYCWKMSPNDEIRIQFGGIAQSLLGSISHRFMGVLVRHLTAAVSSLTEQDLPFLMRVIVQSLLAGSPQDLISGANALNEATKVKFSEVPTDAFGLTETCPACRSPIPLENLLTAVCPNGHAWARCSITSFVLATPMVRTCIGCTRKAFLPPSSRTQGPGTEIPSSSDAAGPVPTAPLSSSNLWIPDAGRSWVVDELLEAVRCCIYCGNRFVRIL